MKKLIETYVGNRYKIHAGGLLIDVEVKDVKISYGKERFLVSPVTGSGEVWVETVLTIDQKLV